MRRRPKGLALRCQHQLFEAELIGSYIASQGLRIQECRLQQKGRGIQRQKQEVKGQQMQKQEVKGQQMLKQEV